MLSTDNQEFWEFISSKLRGDMRCNSVLVPKDTYEDITYEMGVYLNSDYISSKLYKDNGFCSITIYTNQYSLYCSDLSEDLCYFLQCYLDEPIKGYSTSVHKLCNTVGVSYRKLRLFSQLIRGALRISDNITLDGIIPICNSIYTGSVDDPLHKIYINDNEVRICDNDYNIIITRDKKVIRLFDGMYFNVYNPQAMDILRLDDIRIVNSIVHLLELDINWFDIQDIDYKIASNDLEKIKKLLRYSSPMNLVSSRLVQCMNNTINDYLSELSLGLIPSLTLIGDSYSRYVDTYDRLSMEELFNNLSFRNL